MASLLRILVDPDFGGIFRVSEAVAATCKVMTLEDCWGYWLPSGYYIMVPGFGLMCRGF